jgi:hypothetical protein
VITTAAEKAYPVDYSHFNIMGTAVGAHGMEADSDKAIFPAVNLEVKFGHDKGIKFRLPWIIPGIGSTNIAKNNWEGLAIGSALSGTGLTIGENVAGMDPEALMKKDMKNFQFFPVLFREEEWTGEKGIIDEEKIVRLLGVCGYKIDDMGFMSAARLSCSEGCCMD